MLNPKSTRSQQAQNFFIHQQQVLNPAIQQRNAVNLSRPKSSKNRKTLMQRLSNWFEDHLPLRRSARSVSRPQNHRRANNEKNLKRPQTTTSTKQSKSAAPTTHRSTKIVALGAGPPRRNFVENINTTEFQPTANSFGYFREDYVKHRKQFNYEDDNDEMLLITTSAYNPKNDDNYFTRSDITTDILSQSFTTSTNNRKKIRTNPWISNQDQLVNSTSLLIANNHSKLTQEQAFKRGQQMWSSFNCSSGMALSNSGLNNKAPNSQIFPENKWPVYATINRSGMSLLGPNSANKLNESTCGSSGYGSQDSSPESSVHSPDWQPSQPINTSASIQLVAGISNSNSISSSGIFSQNTNDSLKSVNFIKEHFNNNHANLDDAHIYHELECLQRLSMLFDDVSDDEFTEEKRSLDSAEITINEDGCIQPFLNQTPLPTQEDITPPASPIYAVPFEGYKNNFTSSFNETIETPLFLSSRLCKQNCHHMSSYSSNLSLSSESTNSEESCSSWMPVELHRRLGNYSNYYNQHTNQKSTVEVDFLAELDRQIAELQIQSDAVRQLVDAAKERQEARIRTRQLCLRHLNDLRQARQWVMHRNFELCL